MTQIRDFLTVRTSRTLMPRLCLRAWPCLREGVEARAREGRAPRGVMVLALLRQSRMQHCGRALALPLACKAPNEIQACFVYSIGIQCTVIKAQPLRLMVGLLVRRCD